MMPACCCCHWKHGTQVLYAGRHRAKAIEWCGLDGSVKVGPRGTWHHHCHCFLAMELWRDQAKRAAAGGVGGVGREGGADLWYSRVCFVFEGVMIRPRWDRR